MINYSIIIPHYNIPELLVRCLRSIPKRDDVQVIVVDDGSPEADQYVSHYPELSAPGVEFYTVAHRGLAGVMRNIGLSHAQGRWLLFVDADDLLSDDADVIFSTNVDCSADIIFCKSKAVHSEDLSVISNRNLFVLSYFDEYAEGDDSGLRYNFTPLWGKIFCREFITSLDVHFSSTRYSNDVVFSAQTGSQAKKIKVVDIPLYILTERENSLIYHYQHAVKPKLDECEIRLQVAIQVQKYYQQMGLKIPVSGLNVHFNVMRANYKYTYYKYLMYFLFTYPTFAYKFIKRDMQYFKSRIFHTCTTH